MFVTFGLSLVIVTQVLCIRLCQCLFSAVCKLFQSACTNRNVLVLAVFLVSISLIIILSMHGVRRLCVIMFNFLILLVLLEN